MKRIDLTGKKYGRLTVIEPADTKNGRLRWKCKCDCGNERIVHGSALKSGNTKSCGCYKTEKAKKLYSSVRQKDRKLYAVWNGIKQRCRNPNNLSYHNYGGRGIDICDEWANSYEAFYYWAIGNGYRHGLEIDRKDYDGNYEPSNCRWVDDKAQSNNRRNVKKITIHGITNTLSEWCRIYNMDYLLVYRRTHNLGWSIEDALTKPVVSKRKN